MAVADLCHLRSFKFDTRYLRITERYLLQENTFEEEIEPETEKAYLYFQEVVCL